MNFKISNNQINEIETIIQYRFNNVGLLEQAFTHSSFANAENVADNERMEFFGDAILDYIVSEYLYLNYKDLTVGKLSTMRSNLVSATALRPVVKELDLMKHLRVANGAGGIKSASKKIESNLYEAIVAAVYSDGGISEAKKFVLRTLKKNLENAHATLLKDSKTKLQEYCQHNKLPVPQYKMIERFGSENLPQYKYGLYIGDKLVSEGLGTSKKNAEQEAAREIVEKWRIN